MNKNTKQTTTTTTTAAATGPTRKMIPEVRYHPSIQAPTPGAKTRMHKNQRRRPVAVAPPQTGADQEDQAIAKVHPGPSVRPKPDGQTQNQRVTTNSDTSLTPDQIPLSLGVQVDEHTVEEVEVLTRGQSTNQAWFAWRKNRITASVAHRIAHCCFVNGKSKTPPRSYLAAVTGEERHVQTRAMSWGIQMEAEVVRKYQRMKSSALGQAIKVLDCGLFIDSERPWLAASPDGIVMDGQTGKWLSCLEVKCPYKHRHRRVEDACRDDRAFCLEILDQDEQQPGRSPVYRLKKSHSYFTQIQVQLAVTRMQQADLVVFTLKETAIVQVDFDPDLWEDTVSKLQLFYSKGVLPYLRQKSQQDSAAIGDLSLILGGLNLAR